MSEKESFEFRSVLTWLEIYRRQVGGFTMMRRSDLERVGPLWIKYSEDVRADPDAWQTSGDQYVKVGHWHRPSQVVPPFLFQTGSRCLLRSLMTRAWTNAGAWR